MSATLPTWKKAMFGGIGSIGPEIILLYSKRFTMESFTFQLWQYFTITIFYILLAALVAAIFPYGKKHTPWKAFSVGVALPALIGALASLSDKQIINPRGQTIEGSLFDLIPLF